MKLAIGNVSDDQYGSGVFLKAGSLDLGGLMSEVLRPYAQTPYDTVYGWNSLYAGCENTINLHFDKSVTDRNIYIYILKEPEPITFMMPTQTNILKILLNIFCRPKTLY